MSIVIQSILGTDNVASSRSTINTNFDNIKTAVDALQVGFDTGSQIVNLKNGITPTITLTGSTGEIVANKITIAGSTSLVATGSISGASLAISAASVLSGTLGVAGNAQFTADTRISGILRKDGGVGGSPVDASAPTFNITDKYLVDIDYSAIPLGPTTTLLNLPNGVTGQEILVRCTAISNAGNTDGIAIANLSGAGSTGIRFTAANANITLFWLGTRWLLKGSSSGITIL